MGKIRVKTFGDEETEKKQKNDDKKRVEGKKSAKAPGMKGGERVVSVGPTEEEMAKMESPVAAEEEKETASNAADAKKKEKSSYAKKQEAKKETRSKSYKTVASLIDNKKIYSLPDALEILPKLKRAKFDETVELHLTTTEAGIAGSMTLPHGNGKKLRVAIADDKIIADVEKGKIEFDILLSNPQMMPKLAKVARVLGPKGLMPNPKNGTVTGNPEETAKKYSGGLINYKTEAKAPVMHLSVGKISFSEKQLSENIKTVFNTVKKEKIKKAVLKSTMSPGLTIDYLKA